MINELKKFQAIVKVFGVLLSIFVIALTIYTLKSISFLGSAPQTNVITVSGHGEAFAVPNIATLSFSVEKTAKTVADAQTQVTTLMNDVLATLKTNGIAEKDIKTTSYDVSPKYEYQSSICNINNCAPSKQILLGYTVTNSVQVKVRAIDNAGSILGLLGQKNVTNISGLQFSVENDSAIKTEARNKAIAEARAQAESIAKGLGVSLTRITSFSETSNVPRPMYYAKDMMVSNEASAPTPSIAIGENKASADVSISYEIQ